MTQSDVDDFLRKLWAKPDYYPTIHPPLTAKQINDIKRRVDEGAKQIEIEGQLSYCLGLVLMHLLSHAPDDLSSEWRVEITPEFAKAVKFLWQYYGMKDE